MRTRLKYDPDLECMVEIGGNYFEETPLGPSVIGDGMGGSIEGLRAMYRKDKKHFDSKSRYRADVRAHGLAEVGNEANFQSKETPKPKDYYGERVRDAYEQFAGNHNGMADRVRREEHITEYRKRNG